MASLKKVKLKDEETKAVYTYPEEDEILQEQADELNAEVGKVSTERMEQVVNLVQDRFNLRGNLVQKPFVMTGFNDKGTKCTIQLSNDNYTVTVAIHDMESALQ